MRRKILAISLCSIAAIAVPSHADERDELLELRATTIDLIEALVKEGVLSRDRADRLLARARKEGQVAGKEMTDGKAAVVAVPAEGEKVVRVGYVPQFVRDEIREQVRIELREDVTRDVLAQAKQEAWGMPQALPEWTRKIRISGDMRLRGEGDFMASGNPPFGTAFVDWNEVNDNGGFGGSFLNSDEDRKRARLRMRLGVDGNVTDQLSAGIRIATGSTNSPVSTNETLGDGFVADTVVLDRSFLEYKGTRPDGYPAYSLWGGRMPSPWTSTDLVWDDDLNFEGVAGTYRWNLAGSGSLIDMDDRTRTLYVTGGAFFVDEVELSSQDKYLLGAQVGTQWVFDDQSSLDVGLAWYGYENIAGVRNSPNSTSRDYTAPDFVQKGNSMFDISNDVTPFRRFGLASDFELLNLTFKYDLARFSPMHFILTGDYVRNIGYDADDIRDRLEGGAMFVDSSLFTADPGDGGNEGYLARLTVGWPSVLEARRWQGFLAYKHLERDAVLDAFTDSDFHLGGTNAEGWILGGSLGLADNAWLTARYMSADEIDGPPLGIDVIQIDLNAKF